MESGTVCTGASVWIQGTIVASPGSKQKVELKVDKLVTVIIFVKLNLQLVITLYSVL